MFNYIATELKKLQKAGLIRQFKTITAIRGTRVKIDNKWFISFCTNDYLGLAQHPACRQAAQKATQRFGIGSGASRLMAGTLTPHKELEKAIARFKHTPDALLFTSGYAANIGVLTT
ncbi:MAG: aminotransferase class I/II-fold pyridoxal phosphate-dependent enzyme, partial [Planctomycetes bacterium]|nr:aminotransferase class I/II-fold pyridoxal phosphate-dependent enzyme [Planctomycetota bacterium]